MIGYLDWVILITAMLYMMYAAFRSKYMFERRNYKTAVFWAAQLLFIGRWAIVFWAAQNGTLTTGENVWLVDFVKSDEFTLTTIVFLTTSTVNLSIDWKELLKAFRIEKAHRAEVKSEREGH